MKFNGKCQAKQSDFQTDSSVRGTKPREGLLTCLRVTILLVIAVCSFLEIYLSGICLRDYEHSFIILYLGASLLCFFFCVVGILLFFSVYLMRRTDKGKVLQRFTKLGLWVPIATQCVIIPVVCGFVMNIWPGGDDGGGFGWFFTVCIPTAFLFCLVVPFTAILLLIIMLLKR